MELQRLAINQITTPRWSLAQAIQGYARQGVGGIGIWRDKLAECGLPQARRLLRDTGLLVPSLCKAGDLALLDAQGPHTARDDCRRAIDEAAEIGAATIVFVGGGMGTHASLHAARARLYDVLQEAQAHASQAGVRLGIEPFHPMHAAERGCVNTLAQAHRLCDALGPAASVVLDVFHCWWDPDLDRYLAPPYLQAVSTVQLCDWRVPTRHPVTDRAMVGDGAADVAGMVRRLEANGYRGPYEVEIFSTDWWARDPTDVTRICVQRCMSLERA
ncbi:sugar phosphate isomerase/epimerase [Bordetella sp. BOR01]|uniref:sugar phosphate isomerase/epimerase family protein n=1 Tax=Bordetella sp. BOR01 TaxID=2854779 RepID=UPI001C482443|nr:sugar phosphate isomerase/epimerase family protein [Bordetella sp. BOR01]MBV7485051.1 sugar phosphate isomerase/epimerase [Bordetella sp. BOR01]